MIFTQLCQQESLPKPIKEHVFSPARKFRFDYAWPEHKVALEQNGGIWMKGQGAHSRPQNIIRDMEKNNEAVRLGWRVIMVQPKDLMTKATFQLLREILKPT